jgi:hypothetical protein
MGRLFAYHWAEWPYYAILKYLNAKINVTNLTKVSHPPPLVVTTLLFC